MIDSLEPFALEITPRERTHCMKCGTRLHGEATGENCWCSTCKYLLRRPEAPFPRYSITEPPRAVLDELGLELTFDEKQAVEAIPSGRHVEQWYDPEIAESSVFDRLFRKALSAAA